MSLPKNYTRKGVSLQEVWNYKEQDNRLFGVYFKRGIWKDERYFQKKKNLRKFLDNPELTNVKLVICEVEK